MTTMAFAVLVGIVFVSLLAYETVDARAELMNRRLGLWTWLTSGNWPAKVGAALLILGIGALLRYALVNIAVPAEMKLASGVVIAAVLAYLAHTLRDQRRRRGLYLALGGAAGGVAYLSGYSAFALFDYLANPAGMTLLVLVSASVAVFAVAARAASVAILAMLGAYAAPAFTLFDPGPSIVYGYMFTCSVVVLWMVMQRGWRPLIHLSFLFTLAGGIFFGWSADYYRPEHYAVMQPMLLALVALHIAMPIIERRRAIFAASGAAEPWHERFDRGYFIALPLTAAALTYCIAPTLHPHAAAGMTGLGLLWSIAAVIVLANRNEAVRHGIVALLLFMAAVLALLSNVPATLIGLFAMTCVLTIVVRLQVPGGVVGVASLMVATLAALYVLQSSFTSTTGAPFINAWFGERLFVAILIGWAAWLRKDQAPSFTRALTAIAGLLLLLSSGLELYRHGLRLSAELLHCIALSTLLLTALAGHWRTLGLVSASFIAVVMSAYWIASTGGTAAWIAGLFAVIDVGVLAIVAVRSAAHATASQSALTALLSIPLTMMAWALAATLPTGAFDGDLLLGAATASALLATGIAQWVPILTQRWSEQVVPTLYWSTASLLTWHALLHIEANTWSVIYELVAVAMLSVTSYMQRNRSGNEGRMCFMVVAFALVSQAMLLRTFVEPVLPGRTLTFVDLSNMALPALVSLLWVALGAVLAYLGGRSSSRASWVAGSALMAVAAAKLVLFDFAALGELGNILALIASGLVFLGVAWVVPIPPAAMPTPTRVNAPQPAPEPDPGPASSALSAPSQAPPARLATDGINFRPRRASMTAPDDATIASAPVPATVRAEYEPAAPESPSSPGPQPDAESEPPFKFEYVEAPIRAGRTGWLVAIGIVAILALMMVLPTRIWDFIASEELAAPRAVSPAATTLPAPAKTPRTVAADRFGLAAANVPPAVAAPVIEVRDARSLFLARLPTEFQIYVGGDYQGRELDFVIDDSGNAATQFDVNVNLPDQTVVLVLGAYEPSIWNVAWTARTQIAGVVVSGYHRQVIAGLAKNVPLFMSTNSRRSAYGYFYLSKEEARGAADFVSRVLERPAEAYYLAADGRIEIGEVIATRAAWLQSADTTVESYRDPNRPLVGRSGIDRLLREGKLRRPTPGDILRWREVRKLAQQASGNGGDTKAASGSDDPVNVGLILGTFVITRPLVLPVALSGTGAAVFLLQRGVPYPDGDQGHATIVDLDDGACTGTMCYRN